MSDFFQVDDIVLGKSIKPFKKEKMKGFDGNSIEFKKYSEKIKIGKRFHTIAYYHDDQENLLIIDCDELGIDINIEQYDNGDYGIWLPNYFRDFKNQPYTYKEGVIKNERTGAKETLDNLKSDNPWLEDRIIDEDYLLIFPMEEIEFVEGNIFNDVMTEISEAGKQCDTVAYKFLEDYDKKFKLPQSKNSIIRKAITDILTTGSHITIFSLMKKLTIDLKPQLKASGDSELVKEGQNLMRNVKMSIENVSSNEYIKTPYLGENSAIYMDQADRTQILIQEFTAIIGTRTPKAGKFFKSFKLTPAELANLVAARSEYAARIDYDDVCAAAALNGGNYGGFDQSSNSLGRQNNLSGGPMNNEAGARSQEENVASVISDQNVLNRVGNGKFVSPKAPGEVLTIKEAHAKGWVDLDDFR